jgi:hypothetical protein
MSELEKEFGKERRENDHDDRVEWLLREQILILREIKKCVCKPQYQLTILWIGDNKFMSASSVSLNLTPPYGSNQAVPVETNNGQPFVFTPSNIQWTVQTPSIASFVVNPDGSATFTPLAAGTTGVAVQDTATGAVAQAQLTVTGTAPNNFAMSITWQAPVTAASAAKKV